MAFMSIDSFFPIRAKAQDTTLALREFDLVCVEEGGEDWLSEFLGDEIIGGRVEERVDPCSSTCTAASPGVSGSGRGRRRRG